MDRIKTLLAKQNIEVGDEALKKMEGYMEEILTRNEEINLTAITDRDEFIQKHPAHSLPAAGLPEIAEALRIVDIGTGAGFPGVPLAIVFEDKQFVLIDSLNKRVKIIEELCEALGIDNVAAVHGRAEDLARMDEYRECFDVCVSRAVANMRTLSEYCLPFVRTGGTFIAYKGGDCEEEVASAAKAIETVGGGNAVIHKVQDEDTSFVHSLVCVSKTGETPAAYPRKAGKPAKKPL